MDGVRGLYFHPIEKLLVSASEDGTLKVWDLSTHCDHIDPYITLRGHNKALFALTGPQGGSGLYNNLVYSAGEEGTINVWKVPSCSPDWDAYGNDRDAY